MYRKVDCGTWTDPKVSNLPHHTCRLLWAYLLTNQHTHVSGLYYLPALYASHETGMSTKQVREAGEALEEAGLIRWDREHDVVWVVNFFRHQGRGAKNWQAAASQCDVLHHSPLVSAFLERYPEVADRVSDTVSDRASRPGSADQDQDQKQDQKSPPGTPPASGGGGSTSRKGRFRMPRKRDLEAFLGEHPEVYDQTRAGEKARIAFEKRLGISWDEWVDRRAQRAEKAREAAGRDPPLRLAETG